MVRDRATEHQCRNTIAQRFRQGCGADQERPKTLQSAPWGCATKSRGGKAPFAKSLLIVVLSFEKIEIYSR
jgi:hypothetical protein